LQSVTHSNSLVGDVSYVGRLAMCNMLAVLIVLTGAEAELDLRDITINIGLTLSAHQPR